MYINYNICYASTLTRGINLRNLSNLSDLSNLREWEQQKRLLRGSAPRS